VHDLVRQPALGGPLERRQLGWPEVVEEVAHRGEPVGADQEQVPGALALLGDEAGAAQDPKVMGGDLLRHSEQLGDLAHRSRLVANQRQDAPPVSVRQRTQRPVDRFRLPRHALIQAVVCTNVNLAGTSRGIPNHAS
jgi:hypothetical protein